MGATVANIPWAHEQCEVTPGNYYRVWCAVIFTIHSRDTYLLPVNPILHKDDKFGVRHSHYHIDGRFAPFGGNYIHASHFSDETQGKNVNGAFINSITGIGLVILGLMPRILKAKYATTGLPIAPGSFFHARAYGTWYREQIGKKITKGRCPHWGAVMLKEGDKLRCPLHDLHGCPTTNRIIKHPLDIQA